MAPNGRTLFWFVRLICMSWSPQQQLIRVNRHSVHIWTSSLSTVLESTFTSREPKKLLIISKMVIWSSGSSSSSTLWPLSYRFRLFSSLRTSYALLIYAKKMNLLMMLNFSFALAALFTSGWYIFASLKYAFFMSSDLAVRNTPSTPIFMVVNSCIAYHRDLHEQQE